MTTLSIRTFISTILCSAVLGFALIVATPSQIVHAQDYISPSVTDVQTSNKSQTSIVITWNTSEPTTSLIWYARAQDSGTSITQPTLQEAQSRGLTAYTKIHRTTLSNLEAGKRYAFIVGGLDSSSNLGTSSERTFTTDYSDNSNSGQNPKILSLTIQNISNTSATVVTTSNKSTYAKFTYNIVGQTSNRTISTSTFKPNHSMTMKNLMTDTNYEGRLTITDSNGNTSVSDTMRFKTGTFVNSSNVKIYNTSVSINNNTSMASIMWTTNNNASSAVEYSTDADFRTSRTASRKTILKNHIINIRNLSSNVYYYFRIKSTDSSNNMSMDEGIFYLKR